jgi:hypothetical protein
MGSALLLGAALLLACGGESTSDPETGHVYRVLFIGNSLTYSNDLPGTVARLGAMADVTIAVASVALPNFAVIDHATGMSNAVEMLQQGDWDYVVLQQGPTTTQIGRDTLILAVRQLDPMIRRAGGRPALLMIWPPAGNPDAFDAVRQSYQQAADAVGGLFLPGGEAWRTVLVANPELPLYGPDGFHPGEVGTYLTALVVYEGITGRDARSLPRRAVVAAHPLVLPDPTIRFLQRVAHETVARFAGVLGRS